VYVSLGTLFNADASFYRCCFEALGELDLQVILSVGSNVALASLGRAPVNFHVHSHVPQLDVLRRASVFVTHGGMNSVTESLWYAVPMVVIPQMSEQAMVGRRVEQLGAGVYLSKSEVTAETLRRRCCGWSVARVSGVCGNSAFLIRGRRWREPRGRCDLHLYRTVG
jgi:MGT family glycosyltransferase